MDQEQNQNMDLNVANIITTIVQHIVSKEKWQPRVWIKIVFLNARKNVWIFNLLWKL